MPRKVIIDCDPGQDDAVALFLAMASPEELEILGITTVAGNGNGGYSGDGGPATLARLKFPAGICVNVEGDLFVAGSGRPVLVLGLLGCASSSPRPMPTVVSASKLKV